MKSAKEMMKKKLDDIAQKEEEEKAIKLAEIKDRMKRALDASVKEAKKKKDDKVFESDVQVM